MERQSDFLLWIRFLILQLFLVLQLLQILLKLLILINGHSKARALAHCVEGGVSSKWTISALQLHNNAYIACDEAACGELKVDTYRYFKDVYGGERL